MTTMNPIVFRAVLSQEKIALFIDDILGSKVSIKEHIGHLLGGKPFRGREVVDQAKDINRRMDDLQRRMRGEVPRPSDIEGEKLFGEVKRTKADFDAWKDKNPNWTREYKDNPSYKTFQQAEERYKAKRPDIDEMRSREIEAEHVEGRSLNEEKYNLGDERLDARNRAQTAGEFGVLGGAVAGLAGGGVWAHRALKARRARVAQKALNRNIVLGGAGLAGAGVAGSALYNRKGD